MLVYLYSTIKMMHGPVNLKLYIVASCCIIIDTYYAMKGPLDIKMNIQNLTVNLTYPNSFLQRNPISTTHCPRTFDSRTQNVTFSVYTINVTNLSA